jgi:hypothetical protein
MKFSKARMPKISMRGKVPKFAYIVATVILIAVIFMISSSCSSNLFLETMENIANSLPDDKIANKVAESTPPSGQVATKVADKKNSTTSTTSTTEGFVSGVLFRDTPASFPGSVINPSSWSPPVNVAGKDSAPLNINNLDIFKSAQFSPACCAKGPGSGLSTSMGCVCLSNKDAYFITEGRGGNNMNPSAII